MTKFHLAFFPGVLERYVSHRLDFGFHELLPDLGAALQSAVQKCLVRIFIHPRYIDNGRKSGLIFINCLKGSPAPHFSRAIVDNHCHHTIRFKFDNFHRPFDRSATAFVAPADNRPYHFPLPNITTHVFWAETNKDTRSRYLFHFFQCGRVGCAKNLNANGLDKFISFLRPLIGSLYLLIRSVRVGKEANNRDLRPQWLVRSRKRVEWLCQAYLL